MKQPSAKVVADTIWHGARITTFEVVIPTLYLAQLNTHRAFSRNASSLRAIPTIKLLEAVETDPYVPVVFTKRQKGMVSNDPVEDQEASRAAWLLARDNALASAQQLLRLDVAKQHANRLLTPFTWTQCLVTATKWQNFLTQRLHHDAQPELQMIAKDVAEGLDTNTPDQFTIHYVYSPDWKIDAARCARISYLNHDGTTPTKEQDLALAERLIQDKHLSPFEHYAKSTPGRHHNLTGWISSRVSRLSE